MNVKWLYKRLNVRTFGRRQAARCFRAANGFTNVFEGVWPPAGGQTSSYGKRLYKSYSKRQSFYFCPPERSPQFGKNRGSRGGSQGAAGLHSGAISGEKWGSRKGCKLAKPKKKRGSQSDQADFYNTKKEPRNVKVSPPTALAPAPARRPHRFRILLRRSAQAVGVQQRTVFKRRNALAIRCRARQVVVVRRARETHAGKINDLISAAVQLSSRGK